MRSSEKLRGQKADRWRWGNPLSLGLLSAERRASHERALTSVGEAGLRQRRSTATFGTVFPKRRGPLFFSVPVPPLTPATVQYVYVATVKTS